MHMVVHGGSGGDAYYISGTSGAGGAGGGYPAAGIGGGGSGGSSGAYSSGGNGFSSGRTESQSYLFGGTNGTGLEYGAYFSGQEIGGGGHYINQANGVDTLLRAGKGGNISVSDINNIFAYNGSYITDGSIDFSNNSNRENYQSIIYAQIGYNIEKIRNDRLIDKVDSRTDLALLQEFLTLDSKYRDIDYTIYTRLGKMGIGSGAGAIEVSNGLLFIDNN